MAGTQPLLIVGAGGYGAVVRDCVDRDRFDLIGFLDDRPPDRIDIGPDLWLGRIDDLGAIARDRPSLSAVIAIGDNMTRSRVAQRMEQIAPKLLWATVVHPSAIISPYAEVGAGTVVIAGAVVNCGTRIGRHVLINTGSMIDHDNIFGDFASTGPAASTGGNVNVGDFSHVGIGASVRHGIRIGRNCVIGGKAYVERDVEDDVVSFGIPARPQYRREPGQPYL